MADLSKGELARYKSSWWVWGFNVSIFCTARDKTFKELKCLERGPLRYCKGDCNGKVTFTRPFLMLDKLTFTEHVAIFAVLCM